MTDKVANLTEQSKLILVEAEKRLYGVTDIGKILELHRTTIHKKLNGTLKWRKMELNELCRFFHLPLGYFDSVEE